MNDLIIKDDIKIEDLIYEVRGKQVMFDSDLANIYGVETKRINEAVRNNIDKFPERYCFEISMEEYNILRSKFSTSNVKIHGGRRYLPKAFTEQGVYMLATIIKSKMATEVTIAIMDAFVIMKKYINNNLIEQKYINNLVMEHDYDIKLLKESFNKLSTKEEINHIFFEGQIYDAYSLLIDILSNAKEEIIIIDNYAGKKLFDIIKDVMVKVKVYTKNIDNIAKAKYEEQYSNIEIIITDTFHDRFILIDNKTLYHSGASFKDIGSKCFGINKIEDNVLINDLISRLEVTK